MLLRNLRAAVLRSIACVRLRSNRLVILYAHDVGYQAHDLCVPVETFAAQIGVLAEEGYQVTTLSDALALWGRPGRRVALCFDDGFDGVADFARPVLDRHGFQATVFACTRWLGSEPHWAGLDEYLHAAKQCGRAVRLMTADRLADLHARGWEIGAHSVSHPDLRRLALGAAEAEIVESRQVLEQVIGARVTAFAYPYGSADRRLAKLVAATGFSAAVGTRLGHAGRSANRFLLPRLHLSPEIDPPTLRAMVSPLFPAYLSAAAAVRRAVGRTDPGESGRP